MQSFCYPIIDFPLQKYEYFWNNHTKNKNIYAKQQEK